MWEKPESEEELKALQIGAASYADRLQQRWGPFWRDAGPFDWTGCTEVEVVVGKVSGVPVLRNTRMPADSVLSSYEDGESAKQIAEDYELEIAQVEAVLRFAVARMQQTSAAA